MAVAQTNPQKDQSKIDDGERRFYHTHHIKEVDEYFADLQNDLPNDSALFCRLQYDKSGNMVRMIQYWPGAAVQTQPHRITKTSYAYNRHGKLTEKAEISDDYMVFKGVLTKKTDQIVGSKNSTYDYYTTGEVKSRFYDANVIEDRTIYKREFTDQYDYDANGNLMVLRSYNDKNRLNSATEYDYSADGKLIKRTVINGIS